MERIHQPDRENTNQQRATQKKSAADSQNGGISDWINNSSAMVAQRKKLNSLFGGAIQRLEDEEPLQSKSEAVQRVEEEELLQGKFETAQRIEEEEPLQGKFETAQRIEEEEELLQGKFEASSSVQLKEESAAKPNNTGLPDNLKGGIESLSGMSMDNVKVHYNSSQPAQLNALAYAQGTDIHVAPGQEQHLPHEAWHVVQQAQGRVQPTMQMAGTQINDDVGLEKEANVMGERSLNTLIPSRPNTSKTLLKKNIYQLFTVYDSALGGGQGNYGHVDQAGNRTNLTDTNPEQDEKMMTLNLIAHLITQRLGHVVTDNPNLLGMVRVGPHIAVSVVSKHMYIAVNSSYNGDNRGPTDTQLVNAAQGVVNYINGRIGHGYRPLSIINRKKLHALKWVSRVTNYTGFGVRDLTPAAPAPLWNRQINVPGAVHGEQRIMRHLTTDPNERLRLSARATKLSRGGRKRTEKRVIRIGGTLADCIDCHETHHGTVAGQTGHDSLNTHNQGAHHLGALFQSNDALLNARRTRVMSPGTSGQSWPNWRLQQGGNDHVQNVGRGIPGMAAVQPNITIGVNPLYVFLLRL